MAKKAPRALADRSRYHVPNLERALVIMECLGEHSDGLGISELVERLGFSKNSIYRITLTLEDFGYLSRNEDTKRFTLTRKLLALGFASVTEHNIVEASLDIMRELRDMSKETVLLGTLLGVEGVALAQVPGLHPFKFFLEAGTRFRLHTSAPGKAIVAYLPEAEMEGLLGKLDLVRFNKRTVATPRAFRAEMKRIRDLGYAVDHAEEYDGIHCVGAPVLDQHGYPIASIWITAPSFRLKATDFERVGEMVRSHAGRVSARLGFDII